MGRPRKLKVPKGRIKKHFCKVCGTPLRFLKVDKIYVGYGAGVQIIGNLQMGKEQLVSIWQCPRCETIHYAEAKKL